MSRDLGLRRGGAGAGERRVVRYVVLIASTRATGSGRPRGARGYVDAHHAFERQVAARVQGSGAPLASADTATTLRHDDGGSSYGRPFVELVEQLAGFYLVDLPDLDAAVAAWPSCRGPTPWRSAPSSRSRPSPRDP